MRILLQLFLYILPLAMIFYGFFIIFPSIAYIIVGFLLWIDMFFSPKTLNNSKNIQKK